MSRRYWLMKSEPEVFSISDLKKKGQSLWDGVRNYQARNFMMNEMKSGDLVLFYHSSCEPPGVAGIAQVTAEATPDPTQFDRKSPYFEPRARPEKPVWYAATVGYVKSFSCVLPLEKIKAEPKLKDLPLLKRGNRLSIQPLTEVQYLDLIAMAEHA